MRSLRLRIPLSSNKRDNFCTASFRWESDEEGRQALKKHNLMVAKAPQNLLNMNKPHEKSFSIPRHHPLCTL